MKSLKKVIFITSLIAILLSIISVIAGYTLVIPISRSEQLDSQVLVKGDTINIFKKVDFSKGDWSVYINLSRNDFENLSPAIKKTSCLKTSDIKVLERIRNQWNFVYSGTDIATAESIIYIFKNNKLVFKSGIVLDKDRQGLQNSTYGWMEATEPGVLAETCKNFKKVYWPIIFL
ncbi:hypothetical protein [Arcticibacter sp. MXS-1]|uniref:hypothetical protein n=1 Tax=Arcticibacter sp. MXS-1 TaxID=3341726 RepID=UPI0035A8E4FC